MIEIKPVGCVGCTKLMSRMDEDVEIMIFDYCSLFDRIITDEREDTCLCWHGVLDA